MASTATVGPVRVVWLDITDEPDLWVRMGFDVVDDRVVVNGVEHRLVGPGSTGGDDVHRGVVGWGVSGVPSQCGDIAGIPTTVVDAPPPLSGEAAHPNGVYRTDHLVVRTSNTPTTAADLARLGLEIKGNRATAAGGARVDMRFSWAGDTLLEIVGPPEPTADAGAARITGIAYVTADLDDTARHLGSWSTTPVDAVQPGRRIAALRSEAGSTVPIAFMTPHVSRRASAT